MKHDRFTIEILEDGTTKATTDEVSAPSHDDAEQFLRAMARLAGGETTRTAREDGHDTIITSTTARVVTCLRGTRPQLRP